MTATVHRAHPIKKPPINKVTATCAQVPKDIITADRVALGVRLEVIQKGPLATIPGMGAAVLTRADWCIMRDAIDEMFDQELPHGDDS
jgi:hypothetical protein